MGSESRALRAPAELMNLDDPSNAGLSGRRR